MNHVTSVQLGLISFSSNESLKDLAAAYSSQFSSSHQLTLVNYSSSEDKVTQFCIERAQTLGLASYNKRLIVGAEFLASSNGSLLAKAHYNGQPYHAQPISLAYMLNGLVRHFVGQNYSLTSGVNPLPRDENSDADQTALLALSSGFSIGFCIAFGMAFMTTSFIHFLIKERAVGAKHMQKVSGVGPVVFWLGNLAWDYVNYLLPCFCLLIVFAAFRTEAYINDHRLGIVMLVLVAYGWAVLPLMYLVQFAFRSAPTGTVVVTVFNIFTGE